MIERTLKLPESFVVAVGKTRGLFKHKVKTADLPDESLVNLLAYGMARWTNDRCGGSDLTDEAKIAKAKECVAAMTDGTMGQRGDEVFTLAKAKFREAMIANNIVESAKDFNGKVKGLTNLEAVVEKIAPNSKVKAIVKTFTEAAEKEIAARESNREHAAKALADLLTATK